MPVVILFRAKISNFDFSATAQGFMEDIDDFDLADYPDVAKFRTEFPSCAVMPLSQLTVNETGVDNGDITHFSASVFVRERAGLRASFAVEGWGEGGEQTK